MIIPVQLCQQQQQQQQQQQHQQQHQVYSSGPRPFGVSSSDEEIRSTPECTSCGEEEMESESVSEKGRPYFQLQYNIYISILHCTHFFPVFFSFLFLDGISTNYTYYLLL